MSFRVYYQGEYPKKKRVFFPKTFRKRQQARQFCRNRRYQYCGLTIVYPDGTEERFSPIIC